MRITERDIDRMTEDQLRDFAIKLVEALLLAEEDGVFGKDSWEGYLDIEV